MKWKKRVNTPRICCYFKEKKKKNDKFITERKNKITFIIKKYFVELVP